MLYLFFIPFWPENRREYLISSKEAKCNFKAIVKHYKMWSKPVSEKCLWIETSWCGCPDCSGIRWGYPRSDQCSEQCCLHHFRIRFISFSTFTNVLNVSSWRLFKNHSLPVKYLQRFIFPLLSVPIQLRGIWATGGMQPSSSSRDMLHFIWSSQKSDNITIYFQFLL